MYKIVDTQIEGKYFWDGYVFQNKKEIIDVLASYHEVDYGDNTKYNNIYKFLDTLKNDEERLNWLLEYGQWGLEEV